MDLSRVKKGDRIEANVKGRVFAAPVLDHIPGGVLVDPPKGYSYRHLTARQVRRRLV